MSCAVPLETLLVPLCVNSSPSKKHATNKNTEKVIKGTINSYLFMDNELTHSAKSYLENTPICIYPNYSHHR